MIKNKRKIFMLSVIALLLTLASCQNTSVNNSTVAEAESVEGQKEEKAMEITQVRVPSDKNANANVTIDVEHSESVTPEYSIPVSDIVLPENSEQEDTNDELLEPRLELTEDEDSLKIDFYLKNITEDDVIIEFGYPHYFYSIYDKEDALVYEYSEKDSCWIESIEKKVIKPGEEYEVNDECNLKDISLVKGNTYQFIFSFETCGKANSWSVTEEFEY